MVSMIIGLGNIGEKYAGSRHNLGFMVLDRIFEKWHPGDKKRAPDYEYAEKSIGGRVVRLFWPTTYMNNSGLAVSRALLDFGLELKDILVVVDDYNLPLGKIRVRIKGSDGGHNGLESIINHFETGDFMRLRLGIGPIPENNDTIKFVLGRFFDEELENRNKMLGKAVEAVLYSLNHRPEEVMTKYNSNPAPDEAINDETGAV